MRISCTLDGGSRSVVITLTIQRCISQLLWRGEEAMAAALQLLQAAQQHAAGAERISWAQPLLRPAADAKQARAFAQLLPPNGSSAATGDDRAATGGEEAQSLSDRAASHGMASASGRPHAPLPEGAAWSGQGGTAIRAVSKQEAAEAVPGLWDGAPSAAALGPDGERSAALRVEGAHVVHSERYLRYRSA